MPRSILIVDESPVMQQVIERSLSLSKLPIGRCFVAADGRAALTILRSEKIDLILTDVHMENMNGEEFADQLQRHSSFRHIPLLVVSADRTATSVQHMLDRGAFSFLAKPFTAAMLCTEVARALT